MGNKSVGKYQFNIIRHRGDPQTAETLSGHTVRRQEKVFVREAIETFQSNGVILCAPYDDHFVYLDPVNEQGHWFAMCTCGSPAVVVNGNTLVCYIHTNTGSHIGMSKWT
jgi:hypothetical protein